MVWSDPGRCPPSAALRLRSRHAPRRGVEADDGDVLSAGGFEDRGRAERRVVVDAEHAFQVGWAWSMSSMTAIARARWPSADGRPTIVMPGYFLQSPPRSP